MKYAEISLKNTEVNSTALEALQPEADEGMDRVSVNISYHPPSISIEARDSHALRASVNSYLRWLSVTTDIASKYKIER
ncbi:MAG: KEOPS complex subunit Pcc1 [Thermoplasmata archaeon]